MIELSIIIVNYRSQELVLNCLASVYAGTSGIRFEIIVVDNDSGDDSRQRIISAYPGVRWIQMEYNSGFARANNEGIRQSTSPTVLLLNSDTIAPDNVIGECFSVFSTSENIACGVQLLNPDGSPQISGNYFMKGGLNHLLPLPYLGKLLRKIAFFFKVSTPHIPDASSEMKVDWINGAYLMVKRRAIEKAGLMDEDFFLYAEEAEWCSRLGRLGPLCIYGQFHLIHLQGSTANEAFGSSGKGYFNLFDRKGLQIMLSNLVRIRKQLGVGWFLVHLIILCLEIPLFFAGLSLQKLFKGAKAGYSYREWVGFCRNMGVILEKSLTILRNRKYFYKVL